MLRFVNHRRRYCFVIFLFLEIFVLELGTDTGRSDEQTVNVHRARDDGVKSTVKVETTS